MSFTEAVRDGFAHYATFDGRASRRAFWWWVLFALLVNVGANLTWRASDSTLPLLIVWLGLLLPNLSVSVRRLHDTNNTGWWILLYWVPVIGLLLLVLISYIDPGDETENRYGPPPPDARTAS
jgi:uncharacterized membrane protein YhaH (DUF805 family)